MSSSDPWTAFLGQPTEAHFAPIYALTKDLVWTLCLRILRNSADASDAFQAAYCRWIAAARDRDARPRADEASGLLYRMAVREADALKKRRDRRRRRETPLEDPIAMIPTTRGGEANAPEHAAAQGEIREKLEAIVDRLPDSLRLPILLHFFHGLTHREVAAALDLPLSTVSDRIQGALRRLDPACRKSGLRDAAGALGAVAAAGALFQPALSASTVFANAAAALVSGSLSSGAAGTLLGGLLLMKTKLKIAAAITLMLAGFAGFLAYRETLRQDEPLPPEPLASAVNRNDPGSGPAAEALPANRAGDAGAPAEFLLETAVSWLDTGEPAAGAAVSLLAPGKGSPPVVSIATGPDGLARLRIPASWKEAHLEIRHAESAVEKREVPLPAGKPLRILLTRDVITGSVTDADSGAPIAGAAVRGGGREAAADASGAYFLGAPQPGPQELVASAPGYADRLAQVNHSKPGRSVQNFPLDPASEVHITVLDENNAPIADAQVTPSHFTHDGIFHGDRTVRTGAAGTARLSRINRSTPPSIMVSKDGYRTQYPRPKFAAGEDEASIQVILKRIQEKSWVVAGLITDNAGRPIPGIVVEWKDGGGTRFGDGEVYGQFRAVSRGDGYYRLEIDDDDDRCELGVAGKGWAPIISSTVKMGTPDQPAEVNFTLEPAHWLKGRIVDGAARPLARVAIRVMPSLYLLNSGVAYPAVLRETTSDEEGRFELADLPGPGAAIRLRGTGKPIQEEEIRTDQEVELVYLDPGSIEGRVLDGKTREPIPQFIIKLWGRGASNAQQNPGETFTSPEGRFRFQRLDRKGTYTLIAAAEGYASAEVAGIEAQADGKQAEVLLEMVRARAIEGAVVDAASGQPLAGIEVLSSEYPQARDFVSAGWENFNKDILKLQRTVTGPDGRFQLPEGKPASLVFRGGGRSRLFVPPERRPEYSQPDGRLRFPLERGEILRGVYYRDGKPAADEKIRLDFLGAGLPGSAPAGDKKDESFAFAETGPGGAFQFEGLPPGPYRLAAERKIDEPRPDFNVEVQQRIEVQAGAENAVELGKETGSLAWRGRLTGMERNTSVFAHIRLRNASGNGEELYFETYKSWDWKFACPFLRPGKYQVSVEYYTPGGNHTAAAADLTLTADSGSDLAVPAE